MRSKGNGIPVKAILLIIVCLIVIIGVLVGRHRAKQEPEIPIDEQGHELHTDELLIDGKPVEYDYVMDSEEIRQQSAEGSPIQESNDSAYKNNGEIQCYSRSGGLLTLGLESSRYSGKVILAPSYTPTEDEIIPWLPATQFAFYIRTDAGELIQSNNVVGTFDSEYNFSSNSLYITDRCYDTCVPADYRSEEDYGIAWTDPMLNMGGFPQDVINLQIRMVRIYDSALIDIFHGTIVYDKESERYVLNSIERADVSATEEITDALRSRMIQMAKEFMISDDKHQHIGFVIDDWEYACDNALVEHSGKVYFPKLLSSVGEVIRSGEYFNCDVYAVNLPYSGIGYMTVYIAPELQIRGFTSTIPLGETETTYGILGYDPLHPQSKETLAVPAYLYDEFFSIHG